MKKVIVIGCPDAGKSTFARRLAAKTGLPMQCGKLLLNQGITV